MNLVRQANPYLALAAVPGTCLLGSAGRLDLPAFWAYAAILLAAGLVAGLKVVDPELREERRRPGEGGVDRNLRWMALVLILAHWVVAGMDVGRYHWSDTISVPIQAASLGGAAVSLALLLWAMGVNRFFSPVVRIQQERKHRVITTGPYRWVRHPGYAAGLLCMIAGGLGLGSWVAFIPVLGLIALFVRRTIVEDRYLTQHLPGYEAYRQLVRSRLIPRVW